MTEEEPSRDDLLDATPEAVAMRRARAERAERAARAAAAPPTPPRRPSRRKAIIGGALLLLGGLRVLERSVRSVRN